MRRIDFTLEDASPEGHQSRISPASCIRFYESSYGGVSVVTFKDIEDPQNEGLYDRVIESGLRLSREQAIKLYHKLGDYLVATNEEALTQ